MKKTALLLTTAILTFGIIQTIAQPGRMPGGPRFDGAMSKLFGENTSFSADIESQIKEKSGDMTTMPGKIFFNAGNTRFEMNLSSVSGPRMRPEAAAQMKAMGLDQMIAISRPDKNLSYLIYPGFESYVENQLPDAKTGTNDAYKVETTELGKETVAGHPCVKNKVIVTDSKGKTNESTVWNATDLKNFPMKIVHNDQDNDVTMLFKNVSLSKPAAALFEAPSGYHSYNNMQSLMQEQMMKHMGGGMSQPPGQ